MKALPMRLAALLTLLLATAVFAQDRRIQPIVPHKQVALVIGNAAYSNRPLANPVHDAQAVAQRLRELNFDVTLATNTGRKAMGQAIDQFVDKLGTGDVAFFYYSGHGMQVEGENYLIPIDFQGQNETDVRYDAHPVGRIQERMERSGAQLNMLVLDACRDNPYRSAVRSGAGGLAAMNAGRGTFLAFATAPGRTASDNAAGQYGLFTQYLIEALSMRGLGLDDVFNLVRERVDAASGGKQLPWTLSSVVGRYSFVPAESGGAAIPAPVPTPGISVNTRGSVRRVSEPRISHDGLVAFTLETGASGQSDIYTIPLSGGEPRQLTTDGMSFSPQWSPEGRIFFLSRRAGSPQILTMGRDGSTQMPFSSLLEQPGGIRSFLLLPDGRGLIFKGADSQLHRLGSDGKAVADWKADRVYEEYAVSPDSREVCYADYAGLHVVEMQDGLTRVVVGAQGSVEMPQYSPDGRYLAYRVNRKGLAVLDRSSGAVRTVVEGNAREGQGEIPAFVWLPNSTALFFMIELLNHTEVRRVSASGGNAAVTLSGKRFSDIQFSEDGASLVYVEENEAHARELFQATSDGHTSVLTHFND
jgi:Tol biopolymer transport system component